MPIDVEPSVYYYEHMRYASTQSWWWLDRLTKYALMLLCVIVFHCHSLSVSVCLPNSIALDHHFSRPSISILIFFSSALRISSFLIVVVFYSINKIECMWTWRMGMDVCEWWMCASCMCHYPYTQRYTHTKYRISHCGRKHNNTIINNRFLFIRPNRKATQRNWIYMCVSTSTIVIGYVNLMSTNDLTHSRTHSSINCSVSDGERKEERIFDSIFFFVEQRRRKLVGSGVSMTLCCSSMAMVVSTCVRILVTSEEKKSRELTKVVNARFIFKLIGSCHKIAFYFVCCWFYEAQRQQTDTHDAANKWTNQQFIPEENDTL